MSVSVAVVAQDASVRERLIGIIPTDSFAATACSPDALSDQKPGLFIISLPEMGSPEELLIEHLRADEATAGVPIIIESKLPMEKLQSLDYIASDWTIAIVEEPVAADVLVDTMGFLLESS
ncbi:MAG: hypothetical protein HC914_21870 [Chloroflexaceae bacterium]|nr:hypothetical protein [Chloroflexaceae bacterium]